MADNIINGITVKNPSGFKIERYKVTTLQRLANADMTGDLLAKKIKLYYTYDSISGYDLDIILSAIWEAPGIFFPVKYLVNGSVNTITAYVGSIPSDLYRAGRTTNWVWKNVTFNLIQK
jgi:hypothetical protein